MWQVCPCRSLNTSPKDVCFADLWQQCNTTSLTDDIAVSLVGRRQMEWRLSVSVCLGLEQLYTLTDFISSA